MTEAQLPISAWEHIQTMVREIASQHAKKSSDKSAINALDDVMSFLHLYEDVLKNTPPHSVVLSESQKRLLLATKPVFSSPDEKLRLIKEIESTTTFDLSPYKSKKKRVIRCQRLVSKWVTRLRFRNSLSDLKKTDPECKRMVKRNNVWFEIIETERSYVQGLNDLENTFITPMKQSLGGAEILSRKDFNFLVSNINSIKIFNESLLAKLEELQTQWPSSLCIGAIFNEHAPYLRMYKQYVNNFSNSYVVRQGNKKNARFQELLIEGQRALHGRSLTDLLILPIQRIPRYQMLMRELLKHTPEEHMDYGNIKSALIAIEEITEILDQSKKDAENLEKIFNVFQNLSGDIVEPLIVPNRKYIREGDVKHHGSKRKKHLYLFSDILIVALVNNDGTRVFEELIRLVDCSLTDSPSTSSFTIVNGKHKEKWVVSSIPEKMAWIVDIQSSIELQRKSSSSGNSSPRNRSSSLLAISPRVLAPSDSQTLLSTTPPK